MYKSIKVYSIVYMSKLNMYVHMMLITVFIRPGVTQIKLEIPSDENSSSCNV